MRDRGLLGEDPIRFKTPSWEDPFVDSRPPHGEDRFLCILTFVDFGSRVSLCVLRSSTCVTDSLLVECFPSFLPVISSCSSARSSCFPIGSTPNVKDHPHRVPPYITLLTNEGPSLEKDEHWSKNKHGDDGMRKGNKNGVTSDDFRTLKPP